MPRGSAHATRWKRRRNTGRGDGAGAACAVTLALGLALAATLPGADARAAAPRSILDETFYVHVDVADQLDDLKLAFLVEEANRILQQSQEAGDVNCCANMRLVAPLQTFGTPGDGLDVIDSMADWSMIVGKRVFVQTINWCGSPGSNIIGCGAQPGATMAVALDASPHVLEHVLAHERGHNAGLPHRNQGCALMYEAVSPGRGCLNVSECQAFLNAGPVDGSCDCLPAVVGDPFVPNGTPCLEDGEAGLCATAGLCSASPANDTCALATPVAGTVAQLEFGDRAITEGSATCETTTGDVWYRYTPDCSGDLELDVCDSGFNSVLSLHDDCPGTSSNEQACNDDCPAGAVPECRTTSACLDSPVVRDVDVIVRVSRGGSGPGSFVLRAACQDDPAIDTDGDGLGDVLEYDTLGTSHLLADHDGDGLCDGPDLGVQPSCSGGEDLNGDGVLDPGETSPLLADTDGDLLSDSEEALYGTDPRLFDSDIDGLGDGAEVALGSDPLDPDGDLDGALDGSDNCPFEANPAQLDVGGLGGVGAGDGIGDACQCGDLDGDGGIDGSDSTLLRAGLVDPVGLPLPALTLCRVSSASPVCDIVQSVVLRRALVGATPGIAQVCGPAQP